MTNRIANSIFSLALIGLAAPAFAQTPSPHALAPEGFKYMPSKDVDALTIKPGTQTAPITAYPVDHENYYVEYANRVESGNEAEVHAHWTHYINVISGDATLTYGGTVVKPRDTGPGQVRGASISGGKTVTVHAGDFIQIPAGMPHMFNPAKGGKFHYVVFNIKQ